MIMRSLDSWFKYVILVYRCICIRYLLRYVDIGF